MEVFNFLHLTGRRFVALVIVTLAASFVTAVVLVDQPDSYEAEVVVFVGQALPPERSTFAITPFVGDLEVLISLEPVRREIAAASGIDEIAADALSTRQVNAGTALSVRAVAETPELAETLTAEAARVGLSTLLAQERDRAQRALDAAEIRLLDARAEIEGFRADNDIQDPSAEYGFAVDELSSVQIQLLNSGLSESDLAALEERQAELRAEIDRLAPLRTAYSVLERAVIGAETAVGEALQELSATEALLVGAAGGDFLVASPAEPATSRDAVIAGVVATALVVVVLAVGSFAAIDRHRKRHGAPDASLSEADGSGRPSRGDRKADPDAADATDEQTTARAGAEASLDDADSRKARSRSA